MSNIDCQLEIVGKPVKILIEKMCPLDFLEQKPSWRLLFWFFKTVLDFRYKNISKTEGSGLVKQLGVASTSNIGYKTFQRGLPSACSYWDFSF